MFLFQLDSSPPLGQSSQPDSDERVCERGDPVGPRDDVRPPLLQPLGPDQQDQPHAAPQEGADQVSGQWSVYSLLWRRIKKQFVLQIVV